jgi:dTDP-4-dehydrorhamnose reductase
VTFFSDEVRCPVHAADVAAAILRIAADRSITGPLQVAGPEPVLRVDYARALARFAGLGHVSLREALSASRAGEPGFGDY